MHPGFEDFFSQRLIFPGERLQGMSLGMHQPGCLFLSGTSRSGGFQPLVPICQRLLYGFFRSRQLFRPGSAMKQGGVQIAKTLHFLQGSPLRHKFLFSVHDFRCIHILKLSDEFIPDFGQVVSGFQPRQISLQQFDAGIF